MWQESDQHKMLHTKINQTLWGQTIKVFKYSAALRAFISLLTSKLNPIMAAAQYKTILRFSLACSLYSLSYKLLRKFMNKIWSNRDFEMFFACGFASFALLFATKGDISILKVVLFSRSLIACLGIISERGWIRVARDAENYWQSAETIITMIATFTLSFAYYFNHEGLSRQTHNMITKQSGMTIHEKRFCECVRALYEIRTRFTEVINTNFK